MACEQPAEFQRSEVDMPDALVNVLEADIFADAGNGDVAPLTGVGGMVTRRRGNRPACCQSEVGDSARRAGQAPEAGRYVQYYSLR
jgi:hypothetical protein